jgi:photosystem II stability/assembly factor-like uncharacterized protein
MKKTVLVLGSIILFPILLSGQWVQTNGNFGIDHRINDLTIVDQHLFVGTWGAGIFESSDNGTSWLEKNNGLTSLIVRNIVAHGTKIFAGTRKGVFISTDYGNLWTPINAGLPVTWINGEAFIDIFSIISNGQNVFVGTWGGVYVLSDDNSNWIARQNGLTDSAVFELIFKNSDLFAGTYWEIHPAQGGHVFSSTNNGIDWNISSNGLPDKIINDFTTTEENIFVAVNDYNGIYKSSDDGLNWFPSYHISSSLPNCLITYNLENINYLFVGNYYPNNDGNSIYLSTNEGVDWISISEGLPSLTNTIVWSIAANAEYVFAAVNGIVWRRPFEEILEITEVLSEEPPMSFNLSQNYPNPFNPSTKINYQLPNAGNVTLKVFDVLGNEIATLVDEFRNAGSYEIEFNPASSIKHPASGIYLYRLQAGDFVETKKMILLK